jgi:thymidylate synthase (FAD)
MKAEYIAHMLTDLDVANAARVSFDKESILGPDGELIPDDVGLIQFLARGASTKDWKALGLKLINATSFEEVEPVMNYLKRMSTHWTPFSHPQITVRETVPIFVARQRFKHTIGFTYNEVSRRYVDDRPEFFSPDAWRSRPDNGIKQGSGDTFTGMLSLDHVQDTPESWHEDQCLHSRELYQAMVESGIAPEQARMELPQSMYTSYWVTGSLYAWARAYTQRIDPHAQKEIQALAAQWAEIIQPLFPVSWDALTG